MRGSSFIACWWLESSWSLGGFQWFAPGCKLVDTCWQQNVISWLVVFNASFWFFIIFILQTSLIYCKHFTTKALPIGQQNAICYHLLLWQALHGTGAGAELCPRRLCSGGGHLRVSGSVCFQWFTLWAPGKRKWIKWCPSLDFSMEIGMKKIVISRHFSSFFLVHRLWMVLDDQVIGNSMVGWWYYK